MFTQLFTLFVLSNAVLSAKEFSVDFEWNYVNFTWKDASEMEGYKPENYIVAGLKMYKDTIYLALPRGNKPARVTLTSMSKSKSAKRNQILKPFPSWQANTGDDCNKSLLNVLSMDIDLNGVMWILDGKRDNNITKCRPKIVLYDLERKTQLSSYEIPEEVCALNKGCFVNDIVLDGDFAYMSDTTSSDPGILVYNRKKHDSWKFRNPIMYGTEEASHFQSQGFPFKGISNINGIALSPACSQNRTFYFSALTGYNLYSISTHILKDKSLSKTDISKHIVDHGKKKSQSAGMVFDEAGNLYYGLQPLDAVAKWNSKKPLDKAEILTQDSKVLPWPDSAAIDEDGNLYYLTNNLLKFNNKGLDKDEINFRIVKWHIGHKSYLHCKK